MRNVIALTTMDKALVVNTGNLLGSCHRGQLNTITPAANPCGIVKCYVRRPCGTFPRGSQQVDSMGRPELRTGT